jgi:hypothetical protein
MEAVRYQGTPQMITAQPRQRTRYQPRLFDARIAIASAGMSDLRVISDEFREGLLLGAVLRRDSGIQPGTSGAGARHNQIGAGVDIAMKAA